jgi:aminotransferase
MPTATVQRRLSQIASLILQSEIRSMSVECERIGGVNLAQGICDTELPPLVAQGAIDAICSGLNTYTRLDGIAPLREAIAGKLTAFNGIRANPYTEILVTAGATGALYAASLALC